MTKNTNFEYWQDLLANAPESYKQWFEQEKVFLRENIPQGLRVLEIGSGEGRSLEYLGKGGRLYGVDYNPEEVLCSNARFGQNPDVSILLEDGRNLPFRDNWFDRVLCLTTPANFGEERNRFYSEMRRVVKPSGRRGEILLSVFNEDQSTFEERMGFYRKCNAPIKSIKGTTVVFDYPNGAATSEQFSEEQLKRIFLDNSLIPLEIKKQGLGYFCRLEKY